MQLRALLSRNTERDPLTGFGYQGSCFNSLVGDIPKLSEPAAVEQGERSEPSEGTLERLALRWATEHTVPKQLRNGLLRSLREADNLRRVRNPKFWHEVRRLIQTPNGGK